MTGKDLWLMIVFGAMLYGYAGSRYDGLGYIVSFVGVIP